MHNINFTQTLKPINEWITYITETIKRSIHYLYKCIGVSPPPPRSIDPYDFLKTITQSPQAQINLKNIREIRPKIRKYLEECFYLGICKPDDLLRCIKEKLLPQYSNEVTEFAMRSIIQITTSLEFKPAQLLDSERERKGLEHYEPNPEKDRLQIKEDKSSFSEAGSCLHPQDYPELNHQLIMCKRELAEIPGEIYKIIYKLSDSTADLAIAKKLQDLFKIQLPEKNEQDEIELELGEHRGNIITVAQKMDRLFNSSNVPTLVPGELKKVKTDIGYDGGIVSLENEYQLSKQLNRYSRYADTSVIQKDRFYPSRVKDYGTAYWISDWIPGNSLHNILHEKLDWDENSSTCSTALNEASDENSEVSSNTPYFTPFESTEEKIEWKNRIAYAMLQGMEKVHMRGIANCDIKPDNMICIEKPNCLPEIVPIDFALGRRIHLNPDATPLGCMRQHLLDSKYMSTANGYPETQEKMIIEQKAGDDCFDMGFTLAHELYYRGQISSSRRENSSCSDHDPYQDSRELANTFFSEKLHVKFPFSISIRIRKLLAILPFIKNKQLFTYKQFIRSRKQTDNNWHRLKNTDRLKGLSPIEVTMQLLDSNPKKRISMKQAVNSPCFDQFRQQGI